MADTTRQHEMPKDNNSESVQVLGLGAVTPLTAGAAAVQTGVISAKDNAVVRIFTVSNIYVAIGVGATATSSDTIMPASSVEYFKVKEGERVSVLQVDTGGVLTVTHMN